MPFDKLKIKVVVPAHNEERLIGRVIKGMPPFVDKIIIVDDGSEDGTARCAEESGDDRVFLLRHPLRQGVGAAIVSGYRRALSRGADIVVVMGGDAQMDPRDLPSLLAPLIAGRADYTKGNRLLNPGLYKSMPRLRRFGNRLLSFLTRLAVRNGNIGDSQCGYTAITAAALQKLLQLPLCRGYGYPNEILCNLRILGMRIEDVPVRAVYGDEKSGIRIPLYALKMSFILTRCFFRRLAHDLAIWKPAAEVLPGMES